jgi:hypothetical protein
VLPGGFDPLLGLLPLLPPPLDPDDGLDPEPPLAGGGAGCGAGAGCGDGEGDGDGDDAGAGLDEPGGDGTGFDPVDIGDLAAGSSGESSAPSKVNDPVPELDAAWRRSPSREPAPPADEANPVASVSDAEIPAETTSSGSATGAGAAWVTVEPRDGRAPVGRKNTSTIKPTVKKTISTTCRRVVTTASAPLASGRTHSPLARSLRRCVRLAIAPKPPGVGST